LTAARLTGKIAADAATGNPAALPAGKLSTSYPQGLPLVGWRQKALAQKSATHYINSTHCPTRTKPYLTQRTQQNAFL
jgi:hypothetical protein